ncbi:MAG: hypothetical protein HKP39_06145, partial [Eudoraea sp.]|nr:hypothetical protein [Eudoraea sp.]
MSYWRNKYQQDVVLAILIVVLPFLAYSHLLFSNDNNVLTLFDNHFEHWFQSNEVFVWVILSDLLPLLLLLIMFFTTKSTWKYFLMPLIALYLTGILHTIDYFKISYKYLLSIEGVSVMILFSIVILSLDHLIFRTYRSKIIKTRLRYLLLNKLYLDQKNVNNKIIAIRKDKTKLSLMHYLNKIYYIKTILKNKLRNNSYSKIDNNKHGRRRNEAIIIITLIMITVLWFVDSQIPRGIIEVDFFGFKISSNGFNDVQTFIWIVSRKFIVMVFLSLWFITCKYWWKYAILSPLLLFTYQFWEAFQNVESIDAIGNAKVFPLVLLSVLLVIITSRLVKYQTSLLEFYESINTEVDQIIEELKHEKIIESKRIYNKFKDQLN